MPDLSCVISLDIFDFSVRSSLVCRSYSSAFVLNSMSCASKRLLPPPNLPLPPPPPVNSSGAASLPLGKLLRLLRLDSMLLRSALSERSAARVEEEEEEIC